MGRNMKLNERARSGVPADLRRFFSYRLAALNRSLVKQGGRYFSSAVGLSVPEWRVITMLGCDGELFATELADKALLDPGQSSRVTRSLVSRSILSERADPADGRRTLYALTTTGKAVFNRTIGFAAERQAMLIAALTPEEVAAFDRILDKLMKWSTDCGGET
ncbi:MarR family transcriptional regulator [Roseomonas sp. KE2513]|uniref:MarR family winged helix-turn-helix transcriptional regulator n=1 Tax=Roseomonas sp. KE2513 TaxID=2479202 RepID=UPI001E34BA5F|nr:MarR family winged helix-turn-helix transcriptional regulator [Roseomonas sp. KE2513]MBI0539643.1 MarR family transcriptional regulator [Roseomonas sp. KE2513]